MKLWRCSPHKFAAFLAGTTSGLQIYCCIQGHSKGREVEIRISWIMVAAWKNVCFSSLTKQRTLVGGFNPFEKY